MDAEERMALAIRQTCVLLNQALDDPRAMIAFTGSDVTIEDLQDEIYEILAYLEKTAPEETKETEE